MQEPKWRVKTLLMKLESDRKNGTDYVSGKFSAKTETIFSGLPKPKLFSSFLDKELPLIFTPDEVQEFALKHRLNKSQTKAVNEMNKAAPPICLPAEGYPFRLITKCDKPTPIYGPDGGDPVGCSHCGARWKVAGGGAA